MVALGLDGMRAVTSVHEPAAPTDGAVDMNAPPEKAPDSEREALAALERGDLKGATQILMDAYGTALYRFCRQMVADPDLAEEVHQMTFVQAYQSLGRYAHRSSLRTWLYGIARHRCLDALKIQRRRLRRFELVTAVPEKPDEDTPERQLLDRALAQALRKCLGELNPQVRAAVLLRYHDGFSYPQMKSISGERPATLQARVARAMPVLRRCLEGRGIRP